MSVTPSPIGGFAAQFFDNNGVILSGGKIYTYAAGTTTPQATYTSASGVTPHANPIILDSAGRVPGGEIWLTDGLVYKFVIETATSILIGTYDNITGVNSNFVNYTIQEEVITATAGQTVFNLSTINYTPGTNSLSVYIDGVNQYVGDSYIETDSDTVTFTSGVHVGGEVKFTTAIQTTTGAVNASIVAYDPPFTGGVATNVQDKLAQYVSIKDFGAVGDGVTDDTAAIQAAIDDNPNGSIYIPAGTYIISAGLVADPAVSIYGNGANSIIKLENGVTLSASPQFDARMLWSKNASNITVSGVTFDENTRGGAKCFGSQLYSDIVGLKVVDCFVYDNNNVGITVAGSGGSPGDCVDVLISGNTIYPLGPGPVVPTPGVENGQEGIKTSGNRRVRIVNNYMRTFYDDGISVNGYYVAVPSGYDDGDRDIVIANNTIEAWSRAIIVDGWCENITISGNTCRKMDGATIAYAQPLILISTVIAGSLATSYARNVSVVGNTCEVDTDFSTDCSGISVTSGVGITISGNAIRKDGAAAPTASGIEVAPTSPVKTLIGVKISDNVIHGHSNGIYCAASGADFPVDISMDGNLIQNVTNPVTLVGLATAARNWTVSNNKTNSPNAINWTSGVGEAQGLNNTWNFSAAVPTTGTWSKGQVVWNSSPAFAQPMGWMNITSGNTPGGAGPDFEFRPMAILS